MKQLIFCLVVVFVSCSTQNKLVDDGAVSTIVIDPLANGFAPIRIMPAQFETLTEEVMVIDKVIANAYYQEFNETVLSKDGYNTIRALPLEKIYFKEEAVLVYQDYQSVEIESKYSERKYYKFCPECTKSNGVHLDEIKKKQSGISSVQSGHPYYSTRNYLKVVTRANASLSLKDQGKKIELTGTSLEIKKLLNHPRLRNLKYKIRN